MSKRKFTTTSLTAQIRNLRRFLRLLETTKKKQAREFLKVLVVGEKTVGHCCMGMGAVDLKKNCKLPADIKINIAKDEITILGDDASLGGGITTELPLILLDLYGMTNNEQRQYIGLNDKGEMSFKEIAQKMRKITLARLLKRQAGLKKKATK